MSDPFARQHPRVINIKSKRPFTHYIGRNAVYYGYEQIDAHLGKPKTLEGQSESSVDLFERWARANPRVLDRIRELPANAVLGCWCKPNRCHGDVIVQLWLELHSNDSPADRLR